MKKFFIIPLLVLGLNSCTSSDDPIQPESERASSEIAKKYEASKENTKKQIGETLKMLDGSNSRSVDNTVVSGREFVDYIANMPIEVIDSLYKEYCTLQMEQKYDEAYEATIDLLIENSSLEEVQVLFDFINTYEKYGGNNISLLEKTCKNVSPIIQECMIRSAASIDEFYIIVTETRSRGADSWCLQQLSLKLVQSSIEGDIADVVIDLIPGADVIGACIMAGMDLYGALKTAHEYEMCRVTHVS